IPSTVTCLSDIHSNKEDCVFAGARFISSIKTILPKIGPFLNSNSLVFRSSTEDPVTSEGIKSGVNCMRLNPPLTAFAINFAVNRPFLQSKFIGLQVQHRRSWYIRRHHIGRKLYAPNPAFNRLCYLLCR